MEPGQQSAGDYGYDLVHEDVGRPPDRPGSPRDRQETTRPAAEPDAGSGDLGYDEAHDF
jgi:hypothetical protein